MAKSLDATYDPSKKWKPIEEGIYPAHVKSLTSNSSLNIFYPFLYL